MLDLMSAFAVVNARPDHKEFARCMVDLERSKDCGFYVTVPGVFGDMRGPNDGFQPSPFGEAYGNNIPDNWLLTGIFNYENASVGEIKDAMKFVYDNNMKLIHN